MGVTGVYKVVVIQYDNSYDYELHIKENKYDVFASLKDGILTRSFYNGRTTPWPGKESYNFIFYNAQIDDYMNVKTPANTVVDLTPPGGYHIGGVEFGGTVVNDVVTGAIILKGGMICSVYGKRIKGEPVVNTKIRSGLPGKNSYCTCGTAACTHHGFCDSCNIYDSIHTSVTFKGMKGIPVSQCMIPQYEKLFGKMEQPKLDGHDLGHGPQHFVDK